jgi:hypothetical protein
MQNDKMKNIQNLMTIYIYNSNDFGFEKARSL